MPRSRRPEVAGGIHHVTARGNGRRIVFRDDADRIVFLRFVREVVGRCDWSCLTYCLMDNHFHLLVMTNEPTLAVGMQRLNGRYAQHFNARHGQSGHLWQGRYHSELIEREPHLLEAFRYIALNPVRSGLCKSPEAWPWSAHRAVAGLEPAAFVAVPQTLGYFASYGGNGRDRYRAFIDSALDDLNSFLKRV
jgi:REP-associated tyrosine transposase